MSGNFPDCGYPFCGMPDCGYPVCEGFGGTAPSPADLYDPDNPEPGPFYNMRLMSSLYQDSAGTTPVTAYGDPVGLRIDQSQGGGPVSYKGLTGSFDYYVDATGGDDSNDGTSEGQAWASLNKIAVEILIAGETVRALIKAGTYNTVNDRVDLPNIAAPAAVLEVVCEPGVVMDGTAANAISPTNGWEFSGTETWSAIVYGNGLQVNNYAEPTGDSPNGFGNRGTNHLTVHDAHCDNCDDGFSAHGAATMITYDCSAINAEKGPFVHVDTATVEHHRCYFAWDGLTAGYGSGTPSITLEDCVLVPVSATSAGMNTKYTTYTRCQIGTVANRLQLLGADGTFTDCYLNAYADGTAPNTYLRCYGLFSSRVRTPGGVDMRDSVIVGPATGQGHVIYSNFDGGGDALVTFSNNVVATSAFMSVDPTNAAYLLNAGSVFDGNSLWDGAVYDTDLDPSMITNTITTDPQIGSADSYLMADYASAAGLAGFGPEDVVERAPMEQPGPAGIPGTHEYQPTATARPIYSRHPKSTVRNRIDNSQDFSTADWEKVGEGVGVAPVVTWDVAEDAWKIVFSCGGGITSGDRSRLLSQAHYVLDTEYTVGVSIKGAVGGERLQLISIGGSQGDVVTTTDFQTMTGTNTSGFTNSSSVGLRMLGNDGNTDSVTVYVKWMQEVEGDELTPYQNRVSAYDVTDDTPDTFGLTYDGIDDWMVTTGDLDMTSASAFTVVAGNFKADDDTTAFMMELGTADADGTFHVAAPGGAGAESYRMQINSVGGSPIVSTTGYPAPSYSVVTGSADYANSATTLRIDGVEVDSDSTTLGGTIASTMLYTGARSGALYFTGTIYSDLVIGRLLTPEELAETEQWFADNTPGVTL